MKNMFKKNQEMAAEIQPRPANIANPHGLIEPEERIIKGKTFILSKFPASHGREIIACYGKSLIEKLADYKENERSMLKLMSFVAVPTGPTSILLNNEKIINSHVPSWEMLIEIEMEMLDYNCSFFQLGRIWNSLKDIVQNFDQKNLKTSTDLSEQLSQINKQLSTN
jgi:hypothetical protein